MTAHRFTIGPVRVVSAGHVYPDRYVRVVDGNITAVGDETVPQPGDAVIDGRGATLLPGLVDAHLHLFPGSTQLAALFGVTTVLDMFSKPEVIEPERALDASTGDGGPVGAEVRTSSIGATAPGGHPTLAYSPFPYVTGPADAEEFVDARAAEGADYLKVIYDDGSGAMLDIPALSTATIEALVAAAHRRSMVVAAHVSTAEGAITVVRCGVDVLAHAPMQPMSPDQVGEIARSGVAVIATLSVLDGFPSPGGTMPLLGQRQLAERLPARWRRVVERQANRWMPPQPPDGQAQRDNVHALHAAGVRILAGTDAPNPGLLPGASLHRELQHLVSAGLTPTEALTSASSGPAKVFALGHRGVIEVGARADLLLVAGDPSSDIVATQQVLGVWRHGHGVDEHAYPGSGIERDGLAWQRATTEKILRGIKETWPDVPGPEEVVREDGEVLGQIVPTSHGWQATTSFGAPLGTPSDREDAVEILHDRGLSCLAEPWWVREVGREEWQEAMIMEAAPERIKLRWTDPMVEQPASGQWFTIDDVDFMAR